MIPPNVNLIGSCLVDKYYGGNHKYETITLGRKYLEVGTCSGLVKGDHKSPNNWSFNIDYASDYHGSGYMAEWPYGATYWTGLIPSTASVRGRLSYGPPRADVYNVALGRLYDQLRRDVDLSIDIYQGGQTLKMLKDLSDLIRHPLRELVDQTRHLQRKGLIRHGSDLISRKWLEWQYGVRPTMSTLYELTGSMHDIVYSPSGFLTASSSASMRQETTASTPRRADTWQEHFSFERSDRCRFSIRYGVSNPHLAAAANFTSLNPISFLYENIPYSFVLDWVWDLGGYIRNMETALLSGLQLYSGYVTETSHVKLNARIGDYYTLYGRGYQCVAHGWAAQKNLSRSVLSALPLPRVPSVSMKLGSQRLLSAASLLRQLIS